MPWGSLMSSAYSRHSSFTGHISQIALAAASRAKRSCLRSKRGGGKKTDA